MTIRRRVARLEQMLKPNEDGAPKTEQAGDDLFDELDAARRRGEIDRREMFDRLDAAGWKPAPAPEAIRNANPEELTIYQQELAVADALALDGDADRKARFLLDESDFFDWGWSYEQAIAKVEGVPA